MNKQQVLDQIKADILHQNICPDLAKQANQLVFGTGSVDANVVFIGEAPGKNEDLKGEPFVGASGKFLDEMLDSIGLSRTNIYITNIVKYRPPKNRDPSREEKEAFMPFLYAQLAAIAPKVVVTLGRHSTNCFLPGLQISAIHGQTQQINIKVPRMLASGNQHVDGLQGAVEKRTEPYEDTVKGASQTATKQGSAKVGKHAGFASEHDDLMLVILPLYHPAAALYNGKLRQTLLKDFKTIKQITK